MRHHHATRAILLFLLISLCFAAAATNEKTIVPRQQIAIFYDHQNIPVGFSFIQNTKTMEYLVQVDVNGLQCGSEKRSSSIQQAIADAADGENIASQIFGPQTQTTKSFGIIKGFLIELDKKVINAAKQANLPAIPYPWDTTYTPAGAENFQTSTALRDSLLTSLSSERLGGFWSCYNYQEYLAAWHEVDRISAPVDKIIQTIKTRQAAQTKTTQTKPISQTSQQPTTPSAQTKPNAHPLAQASIPINPTNKQTTTTASAGKHPLADKTIQPQVDAFHKFAIESLFFEAQYLQNKFNAIEQSRKAAEQQREEFRANWINPPQKLYQTVTKWMSGIEGQLAEIEERSEHQKKELDAVKILLTEIKDRKKTFGQIYEEAKNGDSVKSEQLKTLLFEPWRYYKIPTGTNIAEIKDCFTNPTIEMLTEAYSKNPKLAENNENKELYYVLSILSHAKKSEKCAIRPQTKQPPITAYPEPIVSKSLTDAGVLEKQFHENAISDFQRIKLAYSNPLLNILLSLSEEERDGFILFSGCINSGDERVSTYGAITKYLNNRADSFPVLKIEMPDYLSQPVPDCLLKDIKEDERLKKYANPLPEYQANINPLKDDEPPIPFGYESEALLAKTTSSNPLFLYLLNTRSINEGNGKTANLATIDDKKKEATYLKEQILGLEKSVKQIETFFPVKYAFGAGNLETSAWNNPVTKPGSREWNAFVAYEVNEIEKRYIRNYNTIFATPSPWVTCATDFVSPSNVAIFGTQALLGTISKVPNPYVAVPAMAGLLLMNGYFSAATMDKYQTTALLWQYSTKEEKAMGACGIFIDAVFFGHGYLHAKLAHDGGLTNKASYEAIKTYEEAKKQPITGILEDETPVGRVSQIKKTVWSAEENKPKPQLTDLTYHSETPSGSTKSGVYQDVQGNFYVVKELHDKNNPNEFLSEILAARVYRLAGFNVPDMWIDKSTGKLVLISRQIATEGDKTFSNIKPSNDEVAKLYLLSILLDDRDRENKNFLVNEKEGKYYLIDFGGTFDTSSVGRPKPEFIESFSWQYFENKERLFIAKNDLFDRLQEIPTQEREQLFRKTIQTLENQLGGKTLDDLFNYNDDVSLFGFEKERLDILKKTLALRITHFKEYLMKYQDGLFDELDVVKLNANDLQELLKKQPQNAGKIDRTIYDLEKIRTFLTDKTGFYLIHGTSADGVRRILQSGGKLIGMGGDEIYAWTDPKAGISTYVGQAVGPNVAFILLPARETLEGRNFLLFEGGQNQKGLILKSNPESKQSGTIDLANSADGIALVNVDENGRVRNPKDPLRTPIYLKGATVIISRNANFEGTSKKFYELTGIDITKATPEEIENTKAKTVKNLKEDVQSRRLQFETEVASEFSPLFLNLLDNFKPPKDVLQNYAKMREALLAHLESEATRRKISDEAKTKLLNDAKYFVPDTEAYINNIASLWFLPTDFAIIYSNDWIAHPERTFVQARKEHISWLRASKLDGPIKEINKDIEFLEGFDYKKIMATDDSKTLEKQAEKYGFRLLYPDEAAPSSQSITAAVGNYVGSKGALVDFGLLEQYGLISFSQNAYLSNAGVEQAPYYKLSIKPNQYDATTKKLDQFISTLELFRNSRNSGLR